MLGCSSAASMAIDALMQCREWVSRGRKNDASDPASYQPLHLWASLILCEGIITMIDDRSNPLAAYVIEEGVAMPSVHSGNSLQLVPVPDAASTALVQRTVGKPFAPGKSGNPMGRPKGSRNKISELFATAMRDDFAQNGPDAIAKLRQRDPAAYLNLVNSMIPRDALAKAEEQLDKGDFGRMTDVEFVEMMEEGEGGNNALAVTKMRQEQAVSLVLSGKVATIRQAMMLLGADI